MHSPYPVQLISTPEKGARISFSNTLEIVDDALKMTPMSLCFLDDKVILSFDKTKEWNAQCGHRNEYESVEACLKREAFEEAGVTIDIIAEFGRMKYETYYNTKKQYPSVTYIPVYVAKVIGIERLPEGSEVDKVIIADHEEAVMLLGARNDNKLLLSVYQACREFYFVKMTQAGMTADE